MSASSRRYGTTFFLAQHLTYKEIKCYNILIIYFARSAREPVKQTERTRRRKNDL